MRKSVFDHILPSFPSAEVEGKLAQDEAWQQVMSRPSDGSDDPGDYSEWAMDQGYSVYEGVTNMRQSAVNLATAMLWHLLEQQMLIFHMRQVLGIAEEHDVRKDKKKRNQLFRLDNFITRLEDGGLLITKLTSWQKVSELQLVAGAIKHGPGSSLDKLFLIRPDLLNPPVLDDHGISFGRNPSLVELPAGGEDIYIRDGDLKEYFDAAENFWIEFSKAIENHSGI